MIEITIPGEPVPWARARTFGKRHFTPDKQRNTMELIRWEAARIMAGKRLLEGPLSVNARFIFVRPKSHTLKQRKAPNSHYKASKPDATNLLKLIEDALNKIVWNDDAQIAAVTVAKQWGVRPGTFITIETLAGEQQHDQLL